MNGERAGTGVAGGDGLRRAATDGSRDGDRIGSDGKFRVCGRRRRACFGADATNATSELKGRGNEAEH